MTQPIAPAEWLVEPFVMGSADQFARVRELFVRIGFTEREIANRSGTHAPDLDGDLRPGRFAHTDDALSMLVRLFIDSAVVPWSDVREQLTEQDLDALRTLGLLHSSLTDPDQCLATVALYPDERLYIASERHSAIEAIATGIPGDIVYSALTPETQRFVELMPRVRCTDYLELCSGTGVAALIAARDFAERAWAVDITERSTRFARFNAALNGLTNVTALEGDLYDALAGRTFDLITAHPPYMPSFDTEMVFRDGGDDGEQITRRIVAGLARHLRPGGQFFCDCMMSDRTDAPLEVRIREMLGPAHEEFDIVLGQVGTLDPLRYYAGILGAGRTSPDSFVRRQECFKELGIERFITAAFLIQRRREARPVITKRRILSPETTAADFQWYADWATSTVTWDRGSEAFLDARPRRSPHLELRTRSVCRDGRWSVVESTLATLSPFAMEARGAPWFATFLSWCDGQPTARQHLQRLRDAGLFPDSASDADFAQLIGDLADAAFIELDLFPFPDAFAGE